MNKTSHFTWLVVTLVALFTSCVSVQDRQITDAEWTQAQFVDQVSTRFTRFQFLHMRNSERIMNRVHRDLMRQAQQAYVGNFEIRNIVIQGRFSGWQIPYTIVAGYFGAAAVFEGIYQYPAIIPFGVLPFLGNFQRITATGDIVVLDGSEVVRREVIREAQRVTVAPAREVVVPDDSPVVVPDIPMVRQAGLQGAVDAAARVLIANMPPDSTIAVVGIESPDAAASGFVLDTLEFRLVASGRFTMVSRAQLATIRAEQGLHVSGEIDDASAVSIGNMLGANLVITGNISGFGANQRLALRVLDVRTARIVAMALEDF